MSAARNSSKMDPVLVPTHRWLERWASGERGGVPQTLHPLERMRLMKDGAVFGSSAIPVPAEIEYIEQILRASDSATREFIHLWYRDSAPVAVKADRLGIVRSTIYGEWRKHVSYVRGCLRTKGVSV